MDIHEVIDINLYDADHVHFDESLRNLITVEYAQYIYEGKDF